MFESKPKNHNYAKLKSRSYVFLFGTSIYATPCIENLAKPTETGNTSILLSNTKYSTYSCITYHTLSTI